MRKQIALLTVLSAVSCLAGCAPTTPPREPQNPSADTDDPNLNPYERELLRWDRDLRAQFERSAAGLSPRARELLEIDFNRNYPRWKQEVVLKLRAMEREDVIERALQLARQGDRQRAFDLVDKSPQCFTAADGAELKSRICFVHAQELLRLTARQKGWEAAAALISDATFQREMGLSLDQAARLRQDIGTFIQPVEPNRSPPVTGQR